MNRPERSDVTSHDRLTAAPLARRITEGGVTHIVSVPDYVQIALHQQLERTEGITTIYTTHENEAVEVAAGLYIGGQMPLVVMQNQGLYNSLNAIRALAIDAQLPIPMLVGQFGREFDNVSDDPSKSERPLVRNTERLLDALEVPFRRIETDADVHHMTDVLELSQDTQGAAVALVGAHIAWD